MNAENKVNFNIKDDIIPRNSLISIPCINYEG